MKSRITIEIDFNENNRPFIQISNDVLSNDVRDKLVTAFRQSLQAESRWCRIEFPAYMQSQDSSVVGMAIYPLTPLELGKHAQIMEDVYKAHLSWIQEVHEKTFHPQATI